MKNTSHLQRPVSRQWHNSITMLMLTQCESQKNKHQGQKPLIEQIFLLKFLQHPIIPFLVEAEKYRIDWLICLPNSLSACTWAIYMIQVEWLKQFCAINFWEKKYMFDRKVNFLLHQPLKGFHFISLIVAKDNRDSVNYFKSIRFHST